MRIPPQSSARLEARTCSGKVSCSLPLKVEKKTPQELRGVLGEGGAKLELITLSGDISLESEEKKDKLVRY